MVDPINIADEYEKKRRKLPAKFRKLKVKKVEFGCNVFKEDPSTATKIRYNALIYTLNYGSSFIGWLPLPSMWTNILQKGLVWIAKRFSIEIKDIKL